MTLKNKVAIVTGVNREIGAAMAETLAGAGAQVLATHYGEAERVAVLVARVQAAGGTIATIDADLRHIAACQRVAASAVELYGRIDIFAANAGVTLRSPFLETTEATWDMLVNLNLKGAYFGAQAAAQQMVAQGLAGPAKAPYRIVFTSSVTGIQAAPGSSVYAVTKAGLRHMAVTLAGELGQYGITVNAIAPGAVLNERNLAEQPNYEAVWNDITPVGRVGQPQDIANALRFLVSPEAEWISAQTIVVDGGWSVLGHYPHE